MAKIVTDPLFTIKGQFHQHVYVQLLHSKIPKAQKDSKSSVILQFWDLHKKKSALNMMVKLASGVNFTIMFMQSFYA